MLDRYEVGPRLGSGGFGTVYRARHTILGTQVALKVLSPQHATSPEIVQRFLREAKAAASVGSPHIVTVHDAGVVEGVPFLAMELLEGEDLEGRIARAGALPMADAIEIALQVLEALDAAHARGIVHRDMKPANVFLTQRAGQPFVKLLDFGISKIVEPEQRRLTQTGAMLGTPAYMAPEQIVDMRGVDARADLYAVAIILFEALTGRLPYPSDTFAELMARVTGAEAVPLERYLPSAPPALSAVIARGMRHEPAQRFASAAEMARALAEVRAAPVTHGAFSASTGPLAGSPPVAVFAPGPMHGAPMSSAPMSSAPMSSPPMSSAPTAGAPVMTHAPAAPRRATGLWIALGALALLLPIGCVAGAVLVLALGDEEVPPYVDTPAPPSVPPPSVPPPSAPPSVPTPPSEPPPILFPPPPDPDRVGPLTAAPIPSGAPACSIPITVEVDCDRDWEQRDTEPCTSTDRELFLVAAYGDGSPVDVEIARTAAPIVLVLSAYSSTEWHVHLADGVRIDRVILSGYSPSSVAGLDPSIRVETHDRSDGWPIMAWSWEGMTVAWSGRTLANVAERDLGLPPRGYVGCYEPTRFRIGQRAP